MRQTPRARPRPEPTLFSFSLSTRYMAAASRARPTCKAILAPASREREKNHKKTPAALEIQLPSSSGSQWSTSRKANSAIR